MKSLSFLHQVILGSSFLLVAPLAAQVKQAEFKDGVKIKYEVLENTSEGAKPLMIRVGLGSIGLGVQYMQAKTFMIDASMSMYSGAQAGLIWALKTFEKEKSYSIAVKQTSGYNSTTTYRVNGEKIVYNDMFGVHGGIRYFNEQLYMKSPLRYLTDIMVERVLFPFTGSAIVAGPAWYRTAHMKYVVKENGQNVAETHCLTNRIGVIADLMYSPSLSYMLYHPLHDAIEQYDDYRKLGFLITLDRSTTSGTGEKGSGWGYCWQASAGYGPAGFLWLLGYGLTF